jgi:hypothetical protein
MLRSRHFHFSGIREKGLMMPIRCGGIPPAAVRMKQADQAIVWRFP